MQCVPIKKSRIHHESPDDPGLQERQHRSKWRRFQDECLWTRQLETVLCTRAGCRDIVDQYRVDFVVGSDCHLQGIFHTKYLGNFEYLNWPCHASFLQMLSLSPNKKTIDSILNYAKLANTISRIRRVLYKSFKCFLKINNCSIL